MKSCEETLILTVDDDAVNRKVIEKILTGEGYRVRSADGGQGALEMLRDLAPDLILLDVTMPGLDGYEVCARLQQERCTAYIPVIFLTALGDSQDRAKGFSSGAVDYVSKPIQKPALLAKVAEQLKTSQRWKELSASGSQAKASYIAAQFDEFKKFYFAQLGLGAESWSRCAGANSSQLYSCFAALGAEANQTARAIANFLKLPYLSQVNIEEVDLDRLPEQFAKANFVVAARGTFVLANPFDRELVSSLGKFSRLNDESLLAIAEPESILGLFTDANAAPANRRKDGVSAPAANLTADSRAASRWRGPG